MKKWIVTLVATAMLFALVVPASADSGRSVERERYRIEVNEDGRWTNPLPFPAPQGKDAFLPGLECWNPPMIPIDGATQVLYEPDGDAWSMPYWGIELAQVVMISFNDQFTGEWRYKVYIKPFYSEDELLEGYVCAYFSTYNFTTGKVRQVWRWMPMKLNGGRLTMKLPWSREFYNKNGDWVRKYSYPVSIAYQQLLPRKG